MRIQEGKGWRLALDRARQPFLLLVGGEGWASELLEREAKALIEAAQRLGEQQGVLDGLLMPDEQISLEFEVDLAPGSLWLELSGDRQAWGLRFILCPGDGQRALEGGWPSPTGVAVLAALQQLAAPLAASSGPDSPHR